MRRGTLLLDFALAIGVAVILLIVSPGLAVVGLVAVIVLVVCAISLLFDAWRSGRRRRPPPPARRAARRPPAQRPPRSRQRPPRGR